MTENRSSLQRVCCWNMKQCLKACHRKRRLSPKTARKRRQSPNSATVALFCDSRRFRRQIVAEIGDSVDRLLDDNKLLINDDVDLDVNTCSYVPKNSSFNLYISHDWCEHEPVWYELSSYVLLTTYSVCFIIHVVNFCEREMCHATHAVDLVEESSCISKNNKFLCQTESLELLHPISHQLKVCCLGQYHTCLVAFWSLSALERITSSISDVCPVCVVALHSVEHLFNCESQPMYLALQDL